MLLLNFYCPIAVFFLILAITFNLHYINNFRKYKVYNFRLLFYILSVNYFYESYFKRRYKYRCALEMLYLDEDNLEWAKASGEHLNDVEDSLHRDCNGTLLIGGDSITLIKDLDVKGSSLNAKMGTPVRNIRLDPNNSEFIEGKIDGQSIVILTKFVRKIN